MAHDRQQRVKELFHQASELPRERRGAFLTSACGSESDTRAEIEALLEHNDCASDTFMARAAYAPAVPADHAPLPDRIGRYRIVSQIGRGGMGVVYEAEQEEPVRRRVALKVIKLGMDTQQVVARFEQERHALALMDHPNIARVLDAGATDLGRPFFVMELCIGEPITAFGDHHRLSIPARLGLFVQVCRAVQHAHQKAIIHRDLKPSNILVSMYDGRPLAKVIDFGIAKATAGKLTDLTLLTEHRQPIGTPEYMSPEQAEGNPDIDTRADVYSLGVLLYELLTGCTPFDSKAFASASLAEIQHIIREVDPPRPSTRTRGAAQSIVDVASARSTAPLKLTSLLRGELDWIVLKAIEKERGRRYDSAGALAVDIEHHLKGEVILAAPPSASYQLRKFVARHRHLVVGSCVVVAALLIGLAGTLWQASAARREARLARAAEQEAKQIADFQARMLGEMDASHAGEKLIGDIRAKFTEQLDRLNLPSSERDAQLDQFVEQLGRINATDLAADMIDATLLKPAIASIQLRLRDQPAVEASLYQTLADLYRSLGRYAEARPLQEQALETRRRILGEEHEDTLASMQAMGHQLRLQNELDAAEALLQKTLKTCRRVLGGEHPTTLAALYHTGGVHRLRGQFAAAESCWREVLEKRRRTLGEFDPATLVSINNMGYVLQEQGKLEEAEVYYREALEKRRQVLGEDHPDTLISLNFVGYLLFAQHKLDAAEPYWRAALEKRRRILGGYHPHTLTSIANMGGLLRDQGRPAEAEPLLREALEKRRRVLGAAHPLTLESTNLLARFLRSQNRLAEAEALLQE